MQKIPIRLICEVPGQAGNFSIRMVEYILSGQDMVQPLHRHDFFYVLVLEKGAGEHSIDFIPYVVSDLSVFFMRPSQVHMLTLKKGSTGYLMEFNIHFYSPLDKTANQVLRKVSNKNFCLIDKQRFKKITSILSGIFHEYTLQEAGYLEVILASLEIFFIELLRQSPEPSNLLIQGNGTERLEELLSLIEQHISSHKEVGFYAGKLHLTPNQLNTVTKSGLGKTCSEVINDQVMLEAKRYLLATTNQINEIAWQLGYEDVSYFVRWFKKRTGQTPEAFRQNFR